MNHLTTKYLTDEDLLEWLQGSASPSVQAHLANCSSCHAEAGALQDGIARYAIALRSQAAQAHSAHREQDFTPAKALARHRLRWAAAAALALLLAAQTAWMLKPSHPSSRVQSAPAARSTAVSPAAQPSPVSPAAMTDDELLEAVNNDLNRDVPQALAPVSAIAEARNRIAAERATKGEIQ